MKKNEKWTESEFVFFRFGEKRKIDVRVALFPFREKIETDGI